MSSSDAAHVALLAAAESLRDAATDLCLAAALAGRTARGDDIAVLASAIEAELLAVEAVLARAVE
jgi:hypothetical protein